MTILIVGGGIGGLTLALSLHLYKNTDTGQKNRPSHSTCQSQLRELFFFSTCERVVDDTPKLTARQQQILDAATNRDFSVLVLALGIGATTAIFSVLYAVNMYFQSFGAVSIVKVNSAWFHLRERGTFGGIFGILISLGLYFAFDWCAAIVRVMGGAYAFFIPAGILLVLAVVDLGLVRDTPGEAGHQDFDLGDATGGGERLPLGKLLKMMLGSSAILTIAAVEFCSGYLRNAILKTYKPFSEDTGRAARPRRQGRTGRRSTEGGRRSDGGRSWQKAGRLTPPAW